jgi:hypothetical protein
MMALGACKSNEVSALSAALSELTGKVDMKPAGAEGFSPATAESTLDVNGQIQTGDDGRVRLDLSTGTIIRVAPSSMFVLTANDEVDGGLATQIKLELGKIFIILNGGTAEVETPSGVASVQGSYMKVEVDPETHDVYVTCLEGSCSAGNGEGSVNFTDGQKTVLFHQNEDGSWTTPLVEDMTDEEFQEWLDENPEAKELFDQAMATLTALASEPTATSEQTATPEPEAEVTTTPTIVSALPPGGSSSSCLNIIQPAPEGELPFQGQVRFEWEGRPDAQKYVVTFLDGNGNVIEPPFETTETNFEKYVEGILPGGGQYSWKVAAYGEGGVICSTDPITFSKPPSDYVPEPKEPDGNAPGDTMCDPCDYFGGCYDSDMCGGQ